MNQQELTVINLGRSLDDLANLDPRGYGVSKILYSGAKNHTKKPLSVNAAEKLLNTVKRGDFVYIMTGFVLWPYEKPETDGFISSMLLCRALSLAFGVKPVLICPKDAKCAAEATSGCIGLDITDDLESLSQKDNCMGIVCFTKNEEEAKEQAEDILKKVFPSAVISIECPGANSKGVYHNALGVDVSHLESKQDILFEMLKDKGVLNIAIGDLGNEIGMGTISDVLKKYIPYAGENACKCGCRCGIAVKTKADNIITATVSDWGCYAMIAAISYMQGDIDIMHTAELEKEVLKVASKNNIIDMNGDAIPAIDGFGLEINLPIVSLMRELVKSTLSLKETCRTWFEKVSELKYFESVE